MKEVKCEYCGKEKKLEDSSVTRHNVPGLEYIILEDDVACCRLYSLEFLYKLKALELHGLEMEIWGAIDSRSGDPEQWADKMGEKLEIIKKDAYTEKKIYSPWFPEGRPPAKK